MDSEEIIKRIEANRLPPEKRYKEPPVSEAKKEHFPAGFEEIAYCLLPIGGLIVAAILLSLSAVGYIK